MWSSPPGREEILKLEVGDPHFITCQKHQYNIIEGGGPHHELLLGGGQESGDGGDKREIHATGQEHNILTRKNIKRGRGCETLCWSWRRDRGQLGALTLLRGLGLEFVVVKGFSIRGELCEAEKILLCLLFLRVVMLGDNLLCQHYSIPLFLSGNISPSLTHSPDIPLDTLCVAGVGKNLEGNVEEIVKL